MAALATIHSYVPPLLSPTHPFLPFGLIDVFGAMRLSSVINWIASGAFDSPPAPASSSIEDGGDKEKGSKGSKRHKTVKGKGGKARASLLQELAGLMVVVFGGETFLCMCTGATPSWLVNPNLALLFCGIHTLQTRTPLVNLLPSKPSLALELVLALPDAIGRTLLLTRFSIVPLLRPAQNALSLPATPSTLILVPFILAVPFASIAFAALNLFAPSPKLATPAELQPYGWTAVDAWAPVVVPVLFLTLIGPTNGWQYGLGWSEEEALVACIGFVWTVFTLRAVYNFGHNREQWLGLVGLASSEKIKTA